MPAPAARVATRSHADAERPSRTQHRPHRLHPANKPGVVPASLKAFFILIFFLLRLLLCLHPLLLLLVRVLVFLLLLSPRPVFLPVAQQTCRYVHARPTHACCCCCCCCLPPLAKQLTTVINKCHGWLLDGMFLNFLSVVACGLLFPATGDTDV